MAQLIGRYEIIRELGRGGMASVYLARDPYMKRQVAIKVLPHQFTSDPQFRARFKREAEAIAALEHPAIVPVYDYGEHDDQPFLVMRYMPGGSLHDRIAGVPLPLPETARILQRIAFALDVAHSRGIIHRDLKPGNVLFDEYGEPYLSDFGIAKIIQATAAYASTGLIGTPAYMSPEQARGRKDLDSRSDLYSLGVMLFEMLTGQLPYDSDTPIGLAMMHVMEPVPSVLAVKPDLPPECEAVIRRAMAKEREERYRTAGELARGVREVAEGRIAPRPVAEGATIIEPSSQSVAPSVIETPPGKMPLVSPAPRRASSRAWTTVMVIGLVVIGLVVVGSLIALGMATPAPTLTPTATFISTTASHTATPSTSLLPIVVPSATTTPVLPTITPSRIFLPTTVVANTAGPTI